MVFIEMQYFTEEEQKFLRSKMYSIGKNRYLFKNNSHFKPDCEKIDEYIDFMLVWLNNFNQWFEEVSNINPHTLKYDEIQPLVNKLFNTKDGKRNLEIINYQLWIFPLLVSKCTSTIFAINAKSLLQWN